jgi:hypothetical protein
MPITRQPAPMRRSRIAAPIPDAGPVDDTPFRPPRVDPTAPLRRPPAATDLGALRAPDAIPRRKERFDNPALSASLEAACRQHSRSPSGAARRNLGGLAAREIGRTIVEQQALVDRLLVPLIGNGHVLLEGVPELAKTLSLKTLAAATQARFQRIQFTPDMLPADIVGTLIYNPQDGRFVTKHGPIFTNLVLADEINRAAGQRCRAHCSRRCRSVR